MRTRASGVQYKPAAFVGLASDGGVFVSPYPKQASWTYGVIRNSSPTGNEHVCIDRTPKLHYHRSGIASVTLTGHDGLERRGLQLAPLHSLRQAQILSIVTTRTWELPTKEQGAGRGDMLTRVPRWPDSAGWTIYLLAANAHQRDQLLVRELGSVGLLTGATFTHGVVSLAAYGWEAVLVVATSVRDRLEPPATNGGTTVAALAWQPGQPYPSGEHFALWSANLRNPVVKWDEAVPTTLEPVGNVVQRQYAR